MASFGSSSSSNPISSFSKPERPFDYDVFLTLRTAEHYSEAFVKSPLRAAGIRAFIDHNLQGSFPYPEDSFEAMERSRIVVVVFTKEFSESRTCLERLVRIMMCNQTMKKPMFPVFCGVTKEEVREQSGRFKEGFDRLTQKMDVTRYEKFNWRKALTEVASLSGWTLSPDFSKNSTDLINFIKEELALANLAVQSNLVGIQVRVEEVDRLVSNYSKKLKKDVTVVGIWGIEGIGKTTLARAIYDAISINFSNKSFLANISRVWQNDNGPVYLQEQLIWDISHTKLEIHDVKMGFNQLARTLNNKRALIVLDDVNRTEQFMALCGNEELFRSGSKIFITTRNKDLFKHHQVKVRCVYEMKILDRNESLELFCWNAFKQLSPEYDFTALSKKVSTCCEGIPLVLEILGSLLFERTKREWEIVWNKLRRIKNGQIKEKLRLSYDYLDESKKNIFYSLICFYVDKNISSVTHALNSGLDVLIKRSLVKIDTKEKKLLVHDLLQEIGRGVNSNKSKFKYTYDVFLSFRGEDTRKSFTTHLYTALKQASVQVFMDEKGIERGENISSSLLHVIESSRISIIVFSTNYAGSTWCLQELEKIMECHKRIGQDVLPIFYNVRPSDVRKQHNDFGKAFGKLKVKVLSIGWRKALTEAANLSGWDMHNYRTEIELIDDVIETITMKLEEDKHLFIAHHPVGVKSRAHDIIQLLRSESNEVIIAGIWGMGGMGKTTIAKVIYNEVGRTFEAKCFLTNVREVWEQDNGQLHLVEQLLSSIMKARRVGLQNIEIGKTLIKETLRHKRALVVLDDVNKEDQLKVLCGNREWFGRGSKIIITTRDKHLLKFLQVVNVYDMKEMDNDESLELFSWHAFKQPIPERDFVELSRKVVCYSGGLPLALEILGCYLFDREIPDWESVLEKLERIPNDQIHEKLKISYDALSDHTEKDIFLDICCFFIGRDRHDATQILSGCGFHAEIGITRLIERSLVKVDSKNKLDMHDLLRDMGREIIRLQSPEEPEKRSRLWFHDDGIDILTNSTGTIAIKGLTLKLSRNNSQSLSTKAFKKMKKLRLLQLDHVQLFGDYECLSTELRWLSWHGFSLQNMPMNLSLENIVAINLKYSNLTQAWEKGQLLKWLKNLNLSHSNYLTQTPDFSKLPNLEKLVLKDCPRLSMIHPSIGVLKYIVLLSLKDCKELSHLPTSIYTLRSLKTLNISGCSKIEKLEENITQMESLTTLMAYQTAITQVPFSLIRLKSIRYVSLCGYEGLSRDVFPSLIWSWMSPRNNPMSIIRAFGKLPYLIQGLSRDLSAKNSSIMEAGPSSSMVSSCKKNPALIDFHEQVHGEQSETFMSSLTIHVGGSNKVIDTLLKSISQGWNDRGLGYNFLPEDNYPNWLSFKGTGSSVLFKVPHIMHRRLNGLVLCLVFLSPQDSMTSVYPISVLISNHTKATIEFYKRDAIATSKDEEWDNIISNLDPGNEVEVIVTFACKLTMKKTLIYLVYGEDVGN